MLQDAINYQRRVVELEPNATNTRLLGDLFFENGQESQAQEQWRDVVDRVVVTRRNEASRYFDWVNTLILKGLMDKAVDAVDEVEPRFRDSWPVSYRVGRAYAILDRPDLATPVFIRLLEWSDDVTHLSCT